MNYKEFKQINDALKNNCNIPIASIIKYNGTLKRVIIQEKSKENSYNVDATYLINNVLLGKLVLTNPSMLRSYNFSGIKASVKKSVHLLTEDTGSGFKFWNFICNNFFHNVTVDTDKLGIKNNSTLVDIVDNIQLSNNDYYIVLLDSPFGNDNTLRLLKKLKKICKDKTNIIVVEDYICFECLLLSFEYLQDWISQYKGQGINPILLNYLNYFKTDIIPGVFNESECLVYMQEYSNSFSSVNNIEQFASKLLTEITKQSGFSVTKGSLGKCWTYNCHTGKVKDCGLNIGEINRDTTNRITLQEKANLYVNYSCIRSLFMKAGVFNVAH